ncbi:MAG: glycosyltransferase family 39 protein [Phycisphaerales bacterium]|nr:glycosyltransferase family 39 protein [Phycisphaerales bacterium]
MPPGDSIPKPCASPRPAIILALLTIALIVALRLTGPWNILDNDQLRPHAYIQDIIRNSNWLVQHDWTGEVASKPPLYAWIGALPALLTDRVGPLELAIPSTIGVLIAAAAIALTTTRVLGTRAACIATLAFIATPIIIKQSTLARTDALYAGLTTAAALLAFRAYTRPRSISDGRVRGAGWWEFWLVAALATLTKGPLAIVLALAGLLFVRRARPQRSDLNKRRWPEHLTGIALFLALAAGWFIAAWLHEGQPFIDKVLGRELLGHVTGASKEHLDDSSAVDALLHWLVGLFKPTLYLVYHAAPWSIFALLGIVRTFRQPSQDPLRHPLERFCAGWLIVGLFIFSVVPHQRPDLLSPIWAPGAILAASFLASLAESWTVSRARIAAASVVFASLVFTVAVYHIAPRRAEHMQRKDEIRGAFEQCRSLGIPTAMITPLDGPYLFTAFCNTLPPRITEDQAVQLLTGNAPAFVSTNRPDELIRRVRAHSDSRRAYAIVRTDQISVVSNTSEAAPTDSVAALHDALLLETAGCRLLPPRLGTLRISSHSAAPAVIAIRNLTDAPRSVHWRATTGERGTVSIAPFAESLITIPGPATP